jgi:hypothetical protein
MSLRRRIRGIMRRPEAVVGKGRTALCVSGALRGGIVGFHNGGPG